MLKIYDKVPDGREYLPIDQIDMFFDSINVLRNLDVNVGKVLKCIEGVTEIYDKSVKTKFGTTDINNISSGSKALIISILYPDIIVEFTEAGDNVLKTALDIAKTRDLSILLNEPINVGDFNEQIEFNGKPSTIIDFCIGVDIGE